MSTLWLRSSTLQWIRSSVDNSGLRFQSQCLEKPLDFFWSVKERRIPFLFFGSCVLKYMWKTSECCARDGQGDGSKPYSDYTSVVHCCRVPRRPSKNLYFLFLRRSLYCNRTFLNTVSILFSQIVPSFWGSVLRDYIPLWARLLYCVGSLPPQPVFTFYVSVQVLLLTASRRLRHPGGRRSGRRWVLGGKTDEGPVPVRPVSLSKGWCLSNHSIN